MLRFDNIGTFAYFVIRIRVCTTFVQFQIQLARYTFANDQFLGNILQLNFAFVCTRYNLAMSLKDANNIKSV